MSLKSKQGEEGRGRGGEKSFASSPHLLIPYTKTQEVKTNTATPRPAFVPWSLPAALFLMLGIVMAQQHLPWFIGFMGCLSLAALFSVRPIRWLLPLRWFLPILLCLPLGFIRFYVWDGQANPILHLVGQEQTYQGVSDGEVLRLEDPKGAKVLLSPKGKVDVGYVVLQGEISLAPGKRNPGGFDFEGYLRRRGIWGQLYVTKVTSFTPSAPSMQERLRRAVIAGLPEREAGLAQAMNLGVRDDLGELRDIFAASGLAHILALSGLNVGVLVAVLGFALSPLGLWRYPALMLLVVGFLLVVEPSPSVARAGVMACIVLWSLWRGAGKIDVWGTIGLSLLSLLLWNPSWLLDISFQLSYLAVIGLLIFTEPMMKKILGEKHNQLSWWHWKKFFVGSLVVSLAAQLTTLPLIASSFGSIPLLSPLVNVFAVPIATLLVPVGFVVAVVGLISLPLAGVLNHLVVWLYKGLIVIAELGSTLPQLIWGEISPLGYVLFYTGCFAFALLVWGKLKPWRALLVMLAAGLCSAVNIPMHETPEIIFLDVGQGDSTLIRLPGRKEILMDGGGTPFSDFDTGKRTVVPALKALGIDELELVIASHADTDHIEGLTSVLNSIKVQRLVIGVLAPDAPVFQSLIEAAQRHHVEVLQVVRGESLTLGEARLDILNPSRHPSEENNMNSVTFVLNYQNLPKALLMGDLPMEAEAGIAFPDVDIVMAGHHGSKGSTSEALLRATSPKYVILSYGRNNYGHPNDGLLQRVKATGATIFATHDAGAIRLPLNP
jgi:competence protein ComEC